MIPEGWTAIYSDDSGKRLCSYGTLTYRDVFDDLRHTNFCIVQMVHFDRKSSRVTITGQVADRHNDAN
jgi:hypothetical protein